MRLRQFRNAIVLSLALSGSAVPLAAQSADEVRADVFSALSTPLPITIVGPLMTRDVVVVPEGDGFRASLPDASLMGLLPLGQVTLKLTPVGERVYRVSDLGLPADLDFPGLGRLALGGSEIDGLWNAETRSYSDLRWALRDVTFTPGQGGNGVLQLAGLSFDVVKESEATDTESRLKIAAERIAMRGLMPEDVDIAGLSALLVANGEKPVDLYSLLREVIMTSGMGDGGLGLLNLGSSLLGNSYGIIALELSAEGLAIIDGERPATRFHRRDW